MNETALLVGATSSIGAGAAISLGRKIRALVAINANPKIKTTINGAIYWRKNAMVNSLSRVSIVYRFNLLSYGYATSGNTIGLRWRV